MVDVPVRTARRFDGKVVLVVGGGQSEGESVGNGRAAALLYAAEGAHVVVADRFRERADATASEIREHGWSGSAVGADITAEDGVATVVDAALAAGEGRIDVLHNNVGASIQMGDRQLEEIDAATFDRVVALNVRAMAMTCRRVLPSMKTHGQGAIVNISSLATRIDYRNIAYKVSKAGVNALTESLAIEYAPFGIRANAILPGLIDTPMSVDGRVVATGRPRSDVVDERNSHVPLRGRMGTAWDVAKAALFLASDDADFVTGVLLTVDGGQALRAG